MTHRSRFPAARLELLQHIKSSVSPEYNTAVRYNIYRVPKCDGTKILCSEYFHFGSG